MGTFPSIPSHVHLCRSFTPKFMRSEIGFRMQAECPAPLQPVLQRKHFALPSFYLSFIEMRTCGLGERIHHDCSPTGTLWSGPAPRSMNADSSRGQRRRERAGRGLRQCFPSGDNCSAPAPCRSLSATRRPWKSFSGTVPLVCVISWPKRRVSTMNRRKWSPRCGSVRLPQPKRAARRIQQASAATKIAMGRCGCLISRQSPLCAHATKHYTEWTKRDYSCYENLIFKQILFGVREGWRLSFWWEGTQ